MNTVVRAWTSLTIVLEDRQRIEVDRNGRIEGAPGAMVLNVDAMKPGDIVILVHDAGTCYTRGTRINRVIRYY